ncbi:MAG: outer membrane protein transport protein, partial [Pseudomonadota bacterium]
MNKLLSTSAVLAIAATTASAGGLDRSFQSSLAVFDEPGEGTLSFGYVSPTITGTDSVTGTRYDAGESYTQAFASYTTAITDQLTFTFTYDQPFGANIDYNGDPTTDRLAGTFADLSSDSFTGWLRYEFSPRFSVFGGIRAQRAGGDVGLNGSAYAESFTGLEAGRVLGAFLAGAAQGGSATAAGILQTPDVGTALAAAGTGNPTGSPAVQALIGQIAGIGGGMAALQQAGATAQATAMNFAINGGYQASIEDSWGMGYSLGAAYEIPDIALRLAVTYNSSVSHSGDTVETGVSNFSTSGVTEFDTPQSVNIDFQTGIAENTLLTASIRWAEWGEFDVIPPDLNSDLADLDNVYRYTLGVARRFSDEFAGSVTLSYEQEENDDNVSPLGPTDGLIGLTVGGSYESDGVTVSGGINYTMLGNADA